MATDEQLRRARMEADALWTNPSEVQLRRAILDLLVVVEAQQEEIAAMRERLITASPSTSGAREIRVYGLASDP